MDKLATAWPSQPLGGNFDWGSVIFTDETSISSDCESRGHVYLELGTRYDTRYIQRRTVGYLQDLGGQNSFLQLLKTANVFRHNDTTNSGEYVNINILMVYTREKAG